MKSPLKRRAARYRKRRARTAKSTRDARRPPADLPRVVHVVPCGPAQCVCGTCAAEMVVIGYEESEKLDVEPTPVPAEIVEKGLVSSRVVINTVVAKYADYLPLYRQSAMLERDAGVLISRGTIV